MYPAIEPYHHALLQVSELHTIYCEESGNPDGIPVLFLHGGPGAGTQPTQRCFFNPKRYRIILVDQRGCGKSTPFAYMEDNTTQDLVQDLEVIREVLGIEQWLLFGGSWGSALALVYAIAHPKRVLGIVLRGIFLAREHEWQWLLSSMGAARFFPEHWERFEQEVGASLSGPDAIDVLHQQLLADPKTVARAFARWEIAMASLQIDPDKVDALVKEPFAESMGALAIHYAKHHCFLPPNYILENIDKVRNIPTTIVQGQYDMVCPPQSAWQLHQALPKSKLYVEHAGHTATEPAIAKRLVWVLDVFNC